MSDQHPPYFVFQFVEPSLLSPQDEQRKEPGSFCVPCLGTPPIAHRLIYQTLRVSETSITHRQNGLDDARVPELRRLAKLLRRPRHGLLLGRASQISPRVRNPITRPSASDKRSRSCLLGQRVELFSQEDLLAYSVRAKVGRRPLSDEGVKQRPDRRSGAPSRQPHDPMTLEVPGMAGL